MCPNRDGGVYDVLVAAGELPQLPGARAVVEAHAWLVGAVILP